MSRTATATHRPAGPRRAGPWKVAGVAVAVALLVAACGGSDDTLEGEVVKDGLGCTLTQTDRKTDDVPEIAETTKVAADVGKKDLTKGKGCAAETTGYLALDIVGATAADGTVFRNTFDDGGQPLTVRLGQGQLLPGLETGLDGMKVGGRRLITVPADQAYGADGDESLGIGKDAALVFVVDLVGSSDAPLYCNPAEPIAPGPEGSDKPTEVDAPALPAEKLKLTDLKEGTGDEVKAGNYVEVHYLGLACDTGKVFDNSWDVPDGAEPAAGRGLPFGVTVGEGTITGFADGLVGMKVGGRRQVDIPAAEGYAATGSEPNIGPNDPLTFILEVVSVSETAPTTTTVAPETTTTVAGETTTTAAGGDATTTTVAGDAATTTTTAAADEATTTTTEG